MLLEKIDKIEKKSNKVLLVIIDDFKYSHDIINTLKTRYNQDVMINVQVPFALETLLERQDNVKLKETINTMLENVKRAENMDTKSSLDVVKKTLENINTADATRSFYSLMKIAEYIMHYRALKRISAGTEKNVIKKDIISPSMGVWRTYQNNDVVDDSFSEELSIAMQNIKRVLNSQKTQNGTHYNAICDFLNNVRNLTIGHGSLNASICKAIINDFAKLVEVMLEEFIKFEYVLNKEDKIVGILDKDISAMKEIDGTLYLYSFNSLREGKYEYLNYYSGKIIKV